MLTIALRRDPLDQVEDLLGGQVGPDAGQRAGRLVDAKEGLQVDLAGKVELVYLTHWCQGVAKHQRGKTEI